MQQMIMSFLILIKALILIIMIIMKRVAVLEGELIRILLIEMNIFEIVFFNRNFRVSSIYI